MFTSDGFPSKQALVCQLTESILSDAVSEGAIADPSNKSVISLTNKCDRISQF